jgi:uncharacterized lipoprotein YddW (UPF0748 family)
MNTDRRSFIKSSGMAGGLLLANLALPLLGACHGRKSPHPAQCWMWFHANTGRTNAEWERIFSRVKQAGIGGILIGGDAEFLARMVPLASRHGIEVHAWMWTLNRSGDQEALKHPDWYAVSRNGRSCFDQRPYVDYYQWVCPSKAEVYGHIAKQVGELCAVPGLAGIHLDYVRYCDVVLPEALQPVYHLVQDQEYPEFDFCYCDSCRQKFLELTGIDIKKEPAPEHHRQWRQFRYDRVTGLVNRLSAEVHARNKIISAAVFPYPDLARTFCRQSWDEWRLDAVFPMIYHNFYNKTTAWIGQATRIGVSAMHGQRPLYTGLYLPELSAATLAEAVRLSLNAGAAGVALFDFDSFKPEHETALKTNR